MRSLRFSFGLACVALLLPLAAPVSAQTKALSLGSSPYAAARTKAEAVRLQAPPPSPPTSPFYDVDAEGRIWAGSYARYKMSFDRSGATFVPFFGSNAPRNFPLGLRLVRATVGGTGAEVASAVQAFREGDVVSFDRGFATERYTMRRPAVEQSFVIPSLPAVRGEIVLEIATKTELLGAEVGDELHFSNAHGTVAYGAAIAIDADGARCTVERRWRNAGTIELRVPAAFVERASLPLLVDPQIGTTQTYDEPNSRAPDVSVDNEGLSVMVWESIFSLTDSDVFARRYDVDTLHLGTTQIDFTTNSWTGPHVGVDIENGRALVLATKVNASPVETWGRTMTLATPTVLGNQTMLLDGRVEDLTSAPSGRRHSTLIELPMGSRASFVVNHGADPTVPLGGFDPVLYSHGSSSRPYFRASFDYRSGAVAIGGYRVGSLPQRDYAISSPLLMPNGVHECLLVWSEPGPAGDSDVFAQRFELDERTFTGSFGPVLNVTRAEPEAPGVPHHGWDQITPVVECDGHGYVIAYTEDYQNAGNDFDVLVTTLRPRGNGALRIGESRRYFGGTSDSETQPRLASHYGARLPFPGFWDLRGPLHVSITWHREGGASNDVVTGTTYEPTELDTLLALSGPATQTGFGETVDVAGDTNADGVPDVVVADHATDTITVFSGADGSALHTFSMRAAAVCGAGDMNADGYDDIAAGDPDHSIFFPTPAFQIGRVVVYSGRDGSVLDDVVVPSSNYMLGRDVAAAGDLDGDGFDDLVAGANGRVLMISGNPGVGVMGSVTGDPRWSDFGVRVAGGGDVDGDGFSDFAAAARGRVRVFSGDDQRVLYDFSAYYGLQSGAALSCDGDIDGDGHADLIVGQPADAYNAVGNVTGYSGANGSVLLRTEAPASDRFGCSVDHAGDVDGDGFGDVLVGASGGSRLASEGGYVRVISGVSANDYLFYFPRAIERTLLRVDGSSAGLQLGAAVRGAGDVDGDGFADVLVAAPNLGAGASGNGGIFLTDVGEFGEVARATIHGAGCVGSGGRVPRIGFRGRPELGQPFEFRLRGAKENTSTFLYIGTPFQAPLPLDVLGMAGCVQSPNTFAVAPGTTDSAGLSSFALSIPAGTGAVGIPFDAQWITVDPGAPYALTLTLSDAVRFTLGM